jgi:hypothetical protein
MDPAAKALLQAGVAKGAAAAGLDDVFFSRA